jgi:hypothetical protein
MKYLFAVLLLSACAGGDQTITEDTVTDAAIDDEPCNGSYCLCGGCIYDGIQRAWIGCRPNVIENCIAVDGGVK